MVTQQNLAFPMRMIMVVPKHSATTANSWLEIPNNGHKLLIPPRGSITPWYRKYPHPATTRAELRITAGYQSVLPSGFQISPRKSCSKNRPTLVPASRQVRINRASNMMAKWYQNGRFAAPPKAFEKSAPSLQPGSVRPPSFPTAWFRRYWPLRLSCRPQ